MPELLQQWYDACRAGKAYQEALSVLTHTLEKKIYLGLDPDSSTTLKEEMSKREKILGSSSLGKVWEIYGDSDLLVQYIQQRGEIDDFERENFCVQRLLLEVIEQKLDQTAHNNALLQIVSKEKLDPEFVEKENVQLAKNNKIFGKGVNLFALRHFIQKNFLNNLEQKNQWVVLWVFCMNHGLLLRECWRERDFADQMSQEEWFGTINKNIRPSTQALLNYNWLKHPPVEKWNDTGIYTRFFKKGRNSFDIVCQMQSLYLKLEQAYTTLQNR